LTDQSLWIKQNGFNLYNRIWKMSQVGWIIMLVSEINGYHLWQ